MEMSKCPENEGKNSTSMDTWQLIQKKMLDTFYRGVFRLHQQIDQKKGGNVSKIMGYEQNLNDMEHKYW